MIQSPFLNLGSIKLVFFYKYTAKKFGYFRLFPYLCIVKLKTIFKMAKINIREGNNPWGKIVGTYDTETGNVREGNDPWGRIVGHVDGERFREGNDPYGATRYLFEGDNVRHGNNPWGNIDFHTEHNSERTNVRNENNPYGGILGFFNL